MSITKGKKDYVCQYCKQIISKGERHISNNFKLNGKWITKRHCLKCDKLHNQIMVDKTYEALEYSINKNPQFYK